MKQFAITFLSILLMACLAPRPPQVDEVFPREQSTNTHVQTVSAQLNFKKGEKVAPGSLQLFIDGVDVTSQAKIVSTRDWPPSHIEISYKLNGSEPGIYSAEVRFQTQEGRTNSYSWPFSIKSRGIRD